MIESVLSSLFTLENLLWINVGLAGGIMVGALPGLTGTMAMALLLPLTYGLASIPGVMLLLGVYCGSIYGGSITAILINTPGTPASAATSLDGYPMAQKGHGLRALHDALSASTIGGNQDTARPKRPVNGGLQLRIIGMQPKTHADDIGLHATAASMASLTAPAATDASPLPVLSSPSETASTVALGVKPSTPVSSCG